MLYFTHSWQFCNYQFAFYLIFIVFFHYHLVPGKPFPTSNHLTGVHVHESLFFFAQFLFLIPSLPTSCHPALHLYEPVPIFLVSSVCSLDSIYEWNHWYLSHSDWLISLNVKFSRSIHTVSKGKISSFLCMNSIPVCNCPIVVLSTHLLMGT